MQVESETRVWQEGEAWWFNNHVLHQAFNDAASERIHVVFDILPDSNRFLLPFFEQCADVAYQQATARRS